MRSVAGPRDGSGLRQGRPSGPGAAARRRHGDLSADADTLDAAAFRSRYRLP
jgi:hypothetical protein